MCRWIAYKGAKIMVEELLVIPENNIIDQSIKSKSAETTTNGDGFGLGWYGKREVPGLFHSTRPAWNDFNFKDLAAEIESGLFMAHVRATSLATIQETNCHPFRYGKWLFVHNGEIFEFEKFRKELIMAIPEPYFSNISGTTDSEIMFHLALSFGLEKNPTSALSKMAGFIEQTGKKFGVDESLWMTVCVSDGHSMYAVRYASDGEAPTLHHSIDVKEMYKINPALKKRLGENAFFIASEPTGHYQEMWKEVPQSTMITIRDNKIQTSKFQPKA